MMKNPASEKFMKGEPIIKTQESPLLSYIGKTMFRDSEDEKL